MASITRRHARVGPKALLQSLLLLSGILIACSPLGVGVDGGWRFNNDLSARIFRAAEREERAVALRLLEPVLRDEARGGFLYSYDTRMNVHYAILKLSLREAAPLLREVARRPYSIPPPSSPEKREQESYHDLLTITAIEYALLELTTLGDSEAISLNRNHIETPIIGGTAIKNLQRLGDWDATDIVQEMLEKQEPTERAFLTVVEGFSFLAASPRAQASACPIIRRMNDYYASCFDEVHPPGRAGCDWYVPAVRTLSSRLSCSSGEHLKSAESPPPR